MTIWKPLVDLVRRRPIPLDEASELPGLDPWTLAFPRGTEAAYVDARVDALRGLTRLAALLGCLFYLSFVAHDLTHPQRYLSSTSLTLVLAVCVPINLLYVAASLVIRTRSWRLMYAALATLLVHSAVLAWVTADINAHGPMPRPEPLMLQTLFLFLLASMLVRIAVPTAMVAIGLFGLASWAEPPAPGVLADQMFFLVLEVLICTLVGRSQEITHRRAWLQALMLQDAADRDGLTGLFNHRSFFERADRLLRQARREGCRVSMIMLDLDYFKPFNDHHGHAAGDECLRQVGQLLMRAARRPMDLAARLGGEEFALFYYDADPEWLEAQARSLCLAIQHERVPWDEGRQLQFSASLGLASCQPGDEIDAGALARRADAALYRAKEAGRGCVSS